MAQLYTISCAGRVISDTEQRQRKILKMKKASNLLALNVKYGAPGTIRTCDRLVRSQVLYPAELRALCEVAYSASEAI